MQSRGEYTVIEATDGAGKTTAADIVAERLRNIHGREVIRLDEPDSAYNADGEILVPIASEIRRIVKDGSLERSPITNVLLFTAQRRENWLQAIKPSIESGVDVVSARNYFSTIVYQGSEGVSEFAIRLLTRYATDKRYMKPDNLFFLDIKDEDERLRRINNRGPLDKPDTFESKNHEFQTSVANGYRELAKKRGAKPIFTDTLAPEEVAEIILDEMLN